MLEKLSRADIIFDDIFRADLFGLRSVRVVNPFLNNKNTTWMSQEVSKWLVHGL